ncbi:TPA: hypothetical protein EYP66_16815 [Candidatus Poribacteria bacterium]|nr:hypothetical protein [Candidatus Poribacteria bacterium]
MVINKDKQGRLGDKGNERMSPSSPPKDVEPIKSGVKAAPHTPVYKMHRYFARRPYNVFRHLIEHYTNEGDIILDPFCGGGVTVVEGLRLKRKVIGVDINPMATFITRMEVTPVDLDALKDVFKQVESAVKERINALYETPCPECGKLAIADWFEWSNVVRCPRSDCRQPVELHAAEKLGPGKYRCSHCQKADIRPSKCERLKDVMIRIKYKCPYCKAKGEKEPEEFDRRRYAEIEANFDRIVEEEELWYPKTEIPPSWKIDKWAVRQRGFTYFFKFFSIRNLLALALLKNSIKNCVHQEIVSQFMALTFSSTLCWASKMSYLKKGQAVGWGSHDYRIPDIPAEISIWTKFEHRYNAVKLGKSYSQREIGSNIHFANSTEDFFDGKNVLLISTSSDNLPIPDSSMDVIITDPPYGDNVQYSELCNFWTVWIPEVLELPKGVIDNADEAVVNPFFNKDSQFYENMLSEIFRECYRVLKPGGYLVLTFHNKSPNIWTGLLNAIIRAGFFLPKNGVVYQAPIESYTTTLHQKSKGSVLGDFIYSFRKVDLSQAEADDFAEHSEYIEQLAVGAASRYLARVGKASTSELYRHIYQELIPSFVQYAQWKNQGSGKENLAELDELIKSQLNTILRRSFDYKDDMWQLRDMGLYYETTVVEAAKDALKERDSISVDDVYQRIYTLFSQGGAMDMVEAKGSRKAKGGRRK